MDVQGRESSESGSGRPLCLEEREPQDKSVRLDVQRPSSCGGPGAVLVKTIRPSWPESGAEFLVFPPIGHGE